MKLGGLALSRGARYPSLMSATPAVRSAVESSSTAASRLAAILALPLRSEPETDAERAIFEDAQAALREGQRGHSTEEVLAEIDAMRDAADAAE